MLDMKKKVRITRITHQSLVGSGGLVCLFPNIQDLPQATKNFQFDIIRHKGDKIMIRVKNTRESQRWVSEKYYEKMYGHKNGWFKKLKALIKGKAEEPTKPN